MGDSISEAMSSRLEDQGWEVAVIEDQVLPPSELDGPPNLASTSAAFNKVHVWGLHKEFDKVLYLDSDAMVLGNLDDVFDRDISAGLPFAAAPEIMPPDSILPFPSLPFHSLQKIKFELPFPSLLLFLSFPLPYLPFPSLPFSSLPPPLFLPHLHPMHASIENQRDSCTKPEGPNATFSCAFAHTFAFGLAS